MTKSFYLSVLVAFGLILPSVGFAHPDFSNKHDVQKALYAMLLSIDTNLAQNNNLKQKLSDGRTYTIDVQKNYIINSLNRNDKLVIRFEKTAELLSLLTLELHYVPKLNKFNKLLELLEEAIAHGKFKLKLALALAKDAKKFDATRFDGLALQVLKTSPADDAALEAALKTFGVDMLADIKAKKTADKLDHDYDRDVHDLFEGLNNRNTIRKVGTPDFVNRTYIQHYVIEVDGANVSSFSLKDEAFRTPDVLGNALPAN